ncbi:MAG: GntR family transcriptional regulator [Planctomycetes bacterium]|nr:GntR family transcriptional regulator [Planctomycetota bacterium]
MPRRAIDRSQPTLLHVQLRELLADGIRRGEWPVGSMLPSIRDLIDTHGVSLPVVRMALDALAETGIIRTEHGRGSFVVRVPESGTMRLLLFLLCNRSRLDPFFSRVLSGAERAANAAGCALVFRQIEPDDVDGAARQLAALAVDGVVCAGDIDDVSYRALADSGFPFALAGGLMRQQPAPPEVRIIGNDNFQGGRLATDHLLAVGHRRIALITGPVLARHWKLRRLGYEAALREAGVPFDPTLTAESLSDSAEAAEPVVARLLSDHPDITALFAGNDRYALGAYRALRHLGRRLPRDLSIIGYDDLDFAETLDPPLTTIQPDIEGIGEGAIGLVMEALAGQPPRQLLRRVRLIERGSTAPPGP